MLWDGDCAFCRRCKEIAERLDTANFSFAPYQSLSEADLKKVRLTPRRCARALQVVSRSGRVFNGAFAVNYFLWQQPRLRILVVAGCVFPLMFLLEVLAYKIVADNRVLFSKILFPRA